MGLYCGVFNPVHSGHISFAEYCVDALGLDKLIMVPVGDAYCKPFSKLEKGLHRLNMCRLAAEENAKIEVGSFEVDSPERCYTLDTLAHYRQLYSPEKLYLVMGDDTAAGLPNWYGAEEICRVACIVVAGRSGTKKAELESLRAIAEVIECGDFKAENISSTVLRKQLKKGKMPQLISSRVYDYIIENSLYK